MSGTGPDQEARRRIAKDLRINLMCEASAGTGKTKVLVDRMVETVAAGGGRHRPHGGDHLHPQGGR